MAGAQVTLFDLLICIEARWHGRRPTESRYFALPLASLGGSALPQGLALGQNYPNPFNPSTIIPYQLPTATHMQIDVFNVLGQHVATLVDAERQAGFHAATTYTDAAFGVRVGMAAVELVAGAALPAGADQRIASGKRASDSPRYQNPAWSPDGRQIAFSFNRHGNFDIYVYGQRVRHPPAQALSA